MKYNWPDRIKLVLQFLVFSLGTWFIMWFIVMVIGGVFSLFKGNQIPTISYTLLALSIVIQGLRFANQWRNLARQEEAGELPDMQDPRNITTLQTTNLVIGIIILFSGVIIFQLFSKLAGIICFGILIPFWVIDKIYHQKRLAKIREASKNSDSVGSTH